MKRIIGSLAIGIVIPMLVVNAILVFKILYPGSDTGRSLLWFFIWPASVLARLSPDLNLEQLILFGFLIGLILDVAFFSLIAYYVIRTIQRSRRS